MLKIEKLKNAVPASLTIPVEPPKKRAKIIDLSSDDADLLDETDDAVWLKFDRLSLTHIDKQELLNGKLNDRHINYAQRLLHNQFPDAEGLRHTLLQKRKPLKKIASGLQIIHDRGDHWIIASNIGHDNVRVYDSVYSVIEQDTREVSLNLFQLPDSPVIEIAEMQKQVGAKECGLFAIAVAMNILSGSRTRQFQEQQMRSHLLACYQNNVITHFP